MLRKWCPRLRIQGGIGRFLATLILAAVSLPISRGCMGLSCTAAEYKVKEECCPMCDPGYHVFRHCTEYTSTTCTPCPVLTYADHHNGLESCRSCTVCDASGGLKVRRECTPFSDTLCEPLEGYYCTDPIKDGCQGAVEQTQCKPGQFIQQNGTSYSDTVCGDCGNNTYSDGSFTSCKPHTQCPAGYIAANEGTTSSDTVCQRVWHVGLVAGLCAAISILFPVAVICRRTQKKRKAYGQVNQRDEGGVQYDIQETAT